LVGRFGERGEEGEESENLGEGGIAVRESGWGAGAVDKKGEKILSKDISWRQQGGQSKPLEEARKCRQTNKTKLPFPHSTPGRYEKRPLLLCHNQVACR
jgi:hypothetical protein